MDSCSKASLGYVVRPCLQKRKKIYLCFSPFKKVFEISKLVCFGFLLFQAYPSKMFLQVPGFLDIKQNRRPSDFTLSIHTAGTSLVVTLIH
jgi:hypothetical protein